jgi:alkylation response protein AidB-like acyl-CoA dehydrogenase
MTTTARATVIPGTKDFQAMLDEIAVGSKDRDRQDENPFRQVEQLKEAGFGRLRLPTDLGGAGLPVREAFAATIDVARADPIVAHIFRSHFWFVEETLRKHRADPEDPVTAHWLGVVADGALIGNAFAEKGARAAGTLTFDTRLVRDASGDLRLNGEKFYSTGTLFSDYVTVSASTDHASVASIILPTDRDGVERVDDWDGFGQRRTGSGTTRFHNVVIEEEEVLADGPDEAAAEPTVQHASLQLFIYAVVAGVLQAVVDDGAALLRSRARNFSHALTARPADDPLYQQLLGDLSSTAYAARATVLDAAGSIATATDSAVAGIVDADLAAAAQLNVAKTKVFLDGAAPQAASRLLELGGAGAASRQLNLDRHWRNIRTITLHNPTAHKAVVIGDNLVNASAIPTNGYF